MNSISTVLPHGPQLSIRGDWLARLAVWAERQPLHRRLGSWTLLGRVSEHALGRPASQVPARTE